MKIKITHFRWEDSKNGDLQPSFMLKGKKIKPQGGVTYAKVTDGDRTEAGTAVCSAKDNYCKKIGRDIAVGRAIKQLRVKSA